MRQAGRSPCGVMRVDGGSGRLMVRLRSGFRGIRGPRPLISDELPGGCKPVLGAGVEIHGRHPTGADCCDRKRQVRNSRTFRPCWRQVATTLSTRSTNRLPHSLAVPPLVFLHKTAWRSVRSAALFVGSIPRTRRKVHRDSSPSHWPRPTTSRRCGPTGPRRSRRPLSGCRRIPAKAKFLAPWLTTSARGVKNLAGTCCEAGRGIRQGWRWARNRKRP
jgi:hypothetical protein